ncbi:hypothetical protein ABKN59_007107 [Abortiporus biennis]
MRKLCFLLSRTCFFSVVHWVGLRDTCSQRSRRTKNEQDRSGRGWAVRDDDAKTKQRRFAAYIPFVPTLPFGIQMFTKGFRGRTLHSNSFKFCEFQRLCHPRPIFMTLVLTQISTARLELYRTN